MSDLERGAYTPPTADGPLTFDARQPVRGARPIPFTLILSVLVLAALVAAIFVFYRSGVRTAGQAPELVGAPVDDMKAPAPAEAQPQDPAAGLQVYRAEAEPMDTAPAPPQFTAPPEQPQPRPSAPVVVNPPAAPAAQAAPVIRPALPAAPPVQKIAPPPAPAAKVVTPPPPKAVAKAPAEPAPKAAAGGGLAVQVGAVSSPAIADKTWSDAVAAAPGLAAGKGKSVEKIERNGATLYRTAVTGFGSRADAQAFCERLKAGGKSCFVR